MDQQERDKLINEAKSILQGATSGAGRSYDLAMALKRGEAFGYARRLLGRIQRTQDIDDARWRKIRQQHALCTYKDPDLATDVRFDRALEILKGIESLSTTQDRETLGQTGAIYKRKWEVGGQKQDLERSLAYYRRGYLSALASDKGLASDEGYTAVNTAYVLDLLAHQEEEEAREAGSTSEVAQSRRKEAEKIRNQVLSQLVQLAEEYDRKNDQLRAQHQEGAPLPERAEEELRASWWLFVTIAEAYFGLKAYKAALYWLMKAAALPEIDPWQFESSTHQLASLAKLQSKKAGSAVAAGLTEAQQVLREFLSVRGSKVASDVHTEFVGKVGLALSGGGFRASLFHIGALAKLAEMDVLRRVEVLSCVSGGSIIGAHYYLEVRRLLQTKPDEEITRQDYMDIVSNIEKDFLEGVKQNIRTRVAAEWTTNFKMTFRGNYSRTKRAGELYEEEIYSRVKDGEGDKDRFMQDLLVKPVGGPENFKPKYDNWKRNAKVPDLILNSTALNTGHNWQFTASWMGEPPSSISSEVDCNYRLRRMYYDQAPPTYKIKDRIRLGDAVAASACVPGVFEPITLAKLYPSDKSKKKIVVRLVDGGVHDNQGISALLDQGCNVLLVSDASGQMGTIDDPSSGLLSVPLRANNILMARVREAEFRELDARRRSSLLQGVMFIHLKKDLDADPIDWVDCPGPFDASDEARPASRRGLLTSYGIRKDIQERLAAMRTDLDSFSEAEAYALMMSGYNMTERVFTDSMKNFPKSNAPAQPGWRFLALSEAVKGGQGYEELMKRLKVSHMKGFKIWKLLPWLRVASWFAGALAVAGLIWLGYRLRNEPEFKFTAGLALLILLVMVVMTALARIIGPPLKKGWAKTPSEFGIGLVMMFPGFLLARLHLILFDKLFLNYGKIDRVVGDSPPPAEASKAAGKS
jgi:predicted acylesterase/phospholipase RssA